MAIMATLVCVLLIGTAAQIFSERLKIPATGPLLIVGLLFGKDVIGLIQPQILDVGLSLIVKMAVAIIVFEGGLLLNVYDLRHTSRAVTGLITVGLLITTTLAAILAHLFLGLSWEISVLFGAIVSITGPTVITPILEKIKVNSRVRSTLETESVIADPLGVILASIIFFAITNKGEWTYIITHGLETILAGIVVGVLVGLYIYLISNRFRLLPVKYARIVILGAALVAYTVAELFAHEAGVLAAAIAGIVIGSLDIPYKEEVEEFKGDLASISISAVFILLAASLSIADLLAVGWRGILIVGLLMIAVRPIRVFLSTFGSELKTNEKLFISFLGPRGIVAASIATFFSIELMSDKFGGLGFQAEGKVLVAMVFAVILGTVLIEGTAAGRLAKFFKVMPRHTVIIGADETGRLLAERLVLAGETVSIIDNNEENCNEASKLKGINIFCDDATDSEVLGKADIGHAKAVIITTSSDKVNLLISQVIRADYSEKRIVARANLTSSLPAFTEAGIETMSPTHAVAAILENMLLRPSLFKLMAMKSNSEDEKIDEVRVTSSRGIGKNLAEMNLRGCLVVAVRRDGKLIPPNGSTILRYNDTLTLLGNGKSLERAEKILQLDN